MLAVGTKVYVFGGVSEDDLDDSGKDANVAYILDTGKCLSFFRCGRLQAVVSLSVARSSYSRMVANINRADMIKYPKPKRPLPPTPHKLAPLR